MWDSSKGLGLITSIISFETNPSLYIFVLGEMIKNDKHSELGVLRIFTHYSSGGVVGVWCSVCADISGYILDTYWNTNLIYILNKMETPLPVNSSNNNTKTIVRYAI
jgi:hypothetical protein